MDTYFAPTGTSGKAASSEVHTISEHKEATHSAVLAAFASAADEKKEKARAAAVEEAKTLFSDEVWLRNGSNIDPDVLLAEPPAWTPDKEARCCMATGCSKRFTLRRRRHHCRFCGIVVCNSCSRHRALMPLRFDDRRTRRVCGACHSKLQPLQEGLIQSNALQHRVNSKYAGSRGGLRRHMNSPIKHTLSGEIRKAAYSINNIFNQAGASGASDRSAGAIQNKDTAIPRKILAKARGLVFITVAKAGFIGSLRFGTGLVVSRLPDGSWSSPSAVCTMGVGFGAQVGADITDYVMVLATQAAVTAFTGTGVARVGATAGISVGPGRAAEADIHLSRREGGKVTHAYTYAHSKGVFAGVALEIGGIRTRHRVNRKFYGFEVKPSELLSGAVPPPRAAQPLYDELARTGLFNDFVPTAADDAQASRGVGSSSPTSNPQAAAE